MGDEKQDIFGKIDALFERRVGFGGPDPRGREVEDFPLLTEVVSPGNRPASEERRQLDRRQGDRRAGERRQAWPEGLASGSAAFTDEQFARFLSVFEKKLEDLFIRQQLRMEESIRQAVREAKQSGEDEAG